MGIERSAYSLMFAMIAAGTVVGATLSFWLNRRRVALHCVISSGLVLTGTSSLIACALQWAGYGSRPFSLLPEVFVALLGVGLISPSITVEALSDVPQLAGSGSGALRSILMIFGSGVSALLASYCASHFHQAVLATTLTMAICSLAAASVYRLVLRQPAATNG